jgi:hypothetical protein
MDGKLLSPESNETDVSAGMFVNTGNKTQLTNVHRQIVTAMVRVN